MPPLKITEELAADIKARVKAFDFGAIEKIRKAKDDNGTFDVIISTEDVDRAGEIVRQNGWQMENYKNNPIVLWGHDYYSLPIGICTETYATEVRGLPATGARGVFLSADINPFAQQVRRMYDYGVKSGLGVGCTTSVGFIPKDFDTDNRNVITKAELLEFSFVPVPANQGVGPAEGRAFTFQEAKELDLDVAGLRVKGMEFVEKAECKGLGVCEDGECDHNKKEAQAGDSCTMEDGTAGTYGTDGDGALVCQPNAEKAAGGSHVPQKKLLKAVSEEHERHAGEIDKAIEAFTKVAPPEDQGDAQDADKKAQKAAEHVREAMKDLRDAVRDEHDMHRAKSIASLRGFNETDDKAFDRKPHLKAVRDEHDRYEAANAKALDEFEEKLTKGKGEMDEHADWLTGKLDESQRAHRKAIVRIAKGMCKAAFGEEDQADEKTLEILKEYLAPHIDSAILPAVTAKIGAKLSAETKAKVAEVYSHLKAASAVVEALHGGLGNDDGEEGGSDGDGKSHVQPAPRKQRSRSTEDIKQRDELNAHLLAKDILRGITTAAQEGLKTLKQVRR